MNTYPTHFLIKFTIDLEKETLSQCVLSKGSLKEMKDLEDSFDEFDDEYGCCVKVKLISRATPEQERILKDA